LKENFKKMSLTVKNLLAGAVLCGLAAIPSFAQSKVGTINIQQAIISTKDGQKAAAELQTKFEPRRKEIERKNAELQALNQQQQKMGTVASDDAKRKLAVDIEQKNKSLQRDSEDAQAEFDGEQQKILNELGGRIMQVINKFATDNGFTMILDISSPQTPVIWASNTVDITNEVIKLYDTNAPSTMAPAATKSAAPAAAPKTAAPAAKKP
jgi:outer membrane protein